jgi:nucleotide-binding universal stress UspA family protein
LLAERALPFAVSLVRGTHGHLYLLSVASDLSVMAHPWTELDSVIRLNQLAEQLRDQGIAASCRTMHGDPASAILLEAQETQADLIVMSTHAQGRLGGWLCGSFADRVFCESAVPVLLVPGACCQQWPSDRPTSCSFRWTARPHPRRPSDQPVS